jgi:hypothetical protein
VGDEKSVQDFGEKADGNKPLGKLRRRCEEKKCIFLSLAEGFIWVRIGTSTGLL